MQWAQVVVIEYGGKEVTVPLKHMLDIKRIYDVFYELTGLRCMVSLSAGVARVNCDIPQVREGDSNATGT